MMFSAQLLPDLDIDDDGRTGDAPTPSFVDFIGVLPLLMVGAGLVFGRKVLLLAGAIWGTYNAMTRSRPAVVLDDPFGEATVTYIRSEQQ